MTTAMSPANRQALLQALREDQDFREEARVLLLGQEVLNLPKQVAALNERLDEFIAAQKAANAEQREFNAAQREFNRVVESRLSNLENQVGGLTERVDELTVQVGGLTTQMGNLTTRVDDLTTQMGNLTTRVDDLTTQMGNLTTRVDELTTQMGSLTTRVDDLTTQMGNLTTRVDDLTTQMGNLTARVDDLTTQVSGLAEQVGGLTTQMGSLTTRVDGLTNRVGELQGPALEFRVQNIIQSLIFRRLKFSHAQVIKSQSVPATPAFYDFLWDAVARDRITEEAIGQLLAADLLLRARLPDSTEQVHVAVEVSRTIADDDIVRARERADLLAAAAGTAGQAVVIGVIIPEPQRRLGERLGVAVFQEEPPAG